MKTFRSLLALLCLWMAAGVALAEDQPVDGLDLIYMGFQSHKPVPGNQPSPIEDGYFVAIKFWLVDSSGVPDPNQPTRMYASAYLFNPSRTQLPPMLRVSFNGTRLLERMDRLGPYYHIKRPADPGENWISWYAHLSETTFPESFFFENVLGGGPFNLTFPTAYKLVMPDRVVLAATNLSVNGSPLDATRPPASDARIAFFPSRVAGSLQSFTYLVRNVDPSRPTLTIARDPTWVDMGGWGYGTHAGFAGISACNEQVMGFAGRDRPLRYVFRACTVVVKPVEFAVERAR